LGRRVDMTRFEMGRLIGTGLMGSVRIGKLKNENQYVAIKSISKW